LRTAAGLESTLEAIDLSVGLDRVQVLHVNDSKTPFGSRVDRHENIGKGKIGLEAFGRILNHPLLTGRAFILETPIDKPGDDRRNVAALWKLLGREIPSSGAHGGRKPRRRNPARKTARRPRKAPASRKKSKSKSRGK
jgi:deoxyribonuclease-4